MSFFDYDDHYNDDEYELSEIYNVADVLAKICDAAKKNEQIYKTPDDSFNKSQGLNPPVDYALYETDLNNNTFERTLMEGDIIVGFRAYTDASFTLVIKDKMRVDANFKIVVKDRFRIPVTMKAGEFHLAWKNKSCIPSIHIDGAVKVENLKGNVRCIMAHVNPGLWNELLLSKVYLEPRLYVHRQELFKARYPWGR